ncbi:hypothetical protein D3C71_1982510 [compost metagenome]
MEYTPIAVPLPPAGDTLLTREGSEASSRLNAVKNTTVPITSPRKPSAHSQKYISVSSRTLTAPANTRFILRFFSP